MAHAYCTGCKAQVSVVDGRCLLDHRIDPSTVSTSSGRRLRSRRGSAPEPRPEHPEQRYESDPAPAGSRLDFFHLDLRTEEITVPVSSPLEPHGIAESAQAREPERAGGGVALAERPPRDDLVPTNHLIAELWGSLVQTDDPIEGWTLGTIDTDIRVVARRVLLTTLAVIAVTVVGAASWFFAGRGDASLSARLADLEEARSDVTQVVTASDAAIADLGDGTIDDPEDLARTISQIDEAARVMFSAAAELPAEGEHADIRRSSIAISDEALELSRDMSRSSAYVSSVEVMVNRPAFPFQVDDGDLGTVAEQTATWVTRFLSMSSSLPETQAFSTHRPMVIAMADRLPAWQAGYLDALRSGDTDAAGALIEDLELWATDISDALARDLSSAAERFEIEQQLVLDALS